MRTFCQVHHYSKPCSVIGNLIVADILQVVPTIFSSVAVSKGEIEADIRRLCSVTFVVGLSRFFNGTQPRFYSHELISLVFFQLKFIIFFLYFLLLFLHFLYSCPRNIKNFLLFLLSALSFFLFSLGSLPFLLFTLFLFFRLNGLCAYDVPENNSSIVASNSEQVSFV